MLDESKQELERLMGAYKDTADHLQEKKEKERAGVEEFEKKFKSLKQEVIWPAIVEVGNELTNFGHDYHVYEEDGYLDATAVYHPSHITFIIFPSFLEERFRRKESAPYVSFDADSYTRKISITLSTMMAHEGGSVGGYDQVDIYAITREWVQAKIIEVMKTILMIQN